MNPTRCETSHECPDRPDCADPARIWSAVQGALQPAEAQALLDHAASCGSCALGWRLAREAGAEAGVLPAAPAKVVSLRSRRRAQLLAAAVAAAAVAASIPLILRRNTSEQSLRGGGLARLHSALPDAPLPRSHFLLRWTPAGPGARYDVTVATIELRPLHEATALLAPELLVPEAALASVPSGGTVIFIVKARLADGRQAAAVAFEARVQ